MSEATRVLTQRKNELEREKRGMDALHASLTTLTQGQTAEQAERTVRRLARGILTIAGFPPRNADSLAELLSKTWDEAGNTAAELGIKISELEATLNPQGGR